MTRIIAGRDAPRYLTSDASLLVLSLLDGDDDVNLPDGDRDTALLDDDDEEGLPAEDDAAVLDDEDDGGNDDDEGDDVALPGDGVNLPDADLRGTSHHLWMGLGLTALPNTGCIGMCP